MGFLLPFVLAVWVFQFWLIYQASPLWCLVTFLLVAFRGLASGIIFPKGAPMTPPKASHLPMGCGWITVSVTAWFGFGINIYAVLLHYLQQLASSLGH